VGGDCRGDPRWPLDSYEGGCAVGGFDQDHGDLVVVGDGAAGEGRGGMIGQGRLLSGLGPGFRWWFTVGAAPTQSGIFRPIALPPSL
jgi:hypothetical protein